MTTTSVHDKRIVTVRNEETRRFEFDLFLGDEYIGTASSFYEGEERLDALLTQRARRVSLTEAMDAQADDLAATHERFAAAGRVQKAVA